VHFREGGAPPQDVTALADAQRARFWVESIVKALRLARWVIGAGRRAGLTAPGTA
jgi:hypothetical protein